MPGYLDGVATGKLDPSKLLASAKSRVISDFVIAHRELLTESHVRVRDRLIVKRPENKPLFVVAVFDQHPHPFACAKLLVCDFNFDVIALSVFAHTVSSLCVALTRLTLSQVVARKPAIWILMTIPAHSFVLLMPPKLICLHCCILRSNTSVEFRLKIEIPVSLPFLDRHVD